MDLFAADEAATPLTEEEKDGLIPVWIALRSELNAVEQQGVLVAERWAFGRKHRDILTDAFVKRLHQRMFGDVWSWAGKFRKSERNIGVAPWEIATELRVLLENANYWMEHQTFDAEELAVRFHHKLVWIHPFPNGNGRHARLMADLLMIRMGQPRFTWGREGLRANLTDASKARAAYVTALRAADQGQFTDLMTFVRS